MNKFGCFSHTSESVQRIATGMAIAVLAMSAGIAGAQNPATLEPASAPMSGAEAIERAQGDGGTEVATGE